MLSLEVSLSRSHSPTREWGLEDTIPASRSCSALGRQVLEARPTPARGPAQPHLQAPKLGWAQWVAGGWPAPLPGRCRNPHLHREWDLLLRAHHVPQRGIEKRRGEERRGPLGRAAQPARPGHVRLPPTRRRRRRERPQRAALSRWWASALDCLLRAAPLASRSLGSLAEQRKERVGLGGEEGGEEGGKRGGEGGRQGRREENAPLTAAAAGPASVAPGSPAAGREGGRRRAGGDSKTPVSLAAAERALPSPAHCGHRVLYNSAVRHRGRDSRAGPGPSPGPGNRSLGWGWGRRREAEGRAQRPALRQRQLRASAECPVRVSGWGSGAAAA